MQSWSPDLTPRRRLTLILTLSLFFFTEIKIADYTLPDDGRVSEDTKSLIRKLLITNPKERMTASQVKDALESIIAMWRSISAPTSHLQMVPEFSEEEAKAKA